MKRLLRRGLLGVAAAVLVVVLLVAATPQGRAAVRTALFIPQVLPTIPVRPQEWVRPDPVWQKVSYPTANGLAEADLILPAGEGKHSAVLFFLGVAVNEPRDDPRLVRLAEGLARSGMAVMMPWTETQVQQRLVASRTSMSWSRHSSTFVPWTGWTPRGLALADTAPERPW